jgi:hypothetical protein
MGEMGVILFNVAMTPISRISSLMWSCTVGTRTISRLTLQKLR